MAGGPGPRPWLLALAACGALLAPPLFAGPGAGRAGAARRGRPAPRAPRAGPGAAGAPQARGPGGPEAGPSEETLAQLRGNLERLELAWAVPEDDLGALARRVRPQDVRGGEVVFRQGEEGTGFYLVEAGSFGIYVRAEGEGEGEGAGRLVATAGPGECFGERALMHDHPRSATVVAESPGRLWLMQGSDFLQLMSRATQVPERILGSFRENRQLGALFWLLPETDFLGLCKTMYPQDVEAGEVVVAEGDVGTALYVVDSGALEVRSRGGAAGAVGAGPLLGPGASFGELALLHGRPRRASVVATERSRLWVVPAEAFRAALRGDGRPPAPRRMAEFLRGLRLFRGAAEEDLERLAGIVRPQVLKNGELLVRAGEEASRVFILRSGAVKAWAPSDFGESEGAEYAEAGAIIEKESLRDGFVWPCSLRSSDEVTVVLWISKLTLDAMFEGASEQLLQNLESSDSSAWWPFR